MNASLQCISHTFLLSKFFLSGEYLSTLASSSSRQQSAFAADLYQRGVFARRFAELLTQMWNNRFTKVVPREFKAIMSQFAPRLAYSQQDAQEFLCELFAGLESDLSPATASGTLPKGDGYDLGSKSIVGKTFQGRQHSTLKCPICDFISEKVEPFLFLSVPVPSIPTRQITVMVVLRNSPLRTFSVPILKSGYIRDLSQAVARIAGMPAESSALLSDLYHGNAFKLAPDKMVSSIHSKDKVLAHEISGK
jgi:ubiquitin carboxyl-terminal hydrolase 4/11/15